MSATNLGLLIMAAAAVLLFALIILAKRALGKGAETAPHYSSLNDVSAKPPQQDSIEHGQMDFCSIDLVDIHKQSNIQRNPMDPM